MALALGDGELSHIARQRRLPQLGGPEVAVTARVGPRLLVRLRGAASCLLLTACASAPGRAPSDAAAPRQRPAPERSDSLTDLSNAVAEFEAAPSDQPQRDVGRVLRALGRAIEPVSHGEHLRLQRAGRALAATPAGSLSHAGRLKQSLAQLLHTLISKASAPARGTALRRTLRALKDKTLALDELLPVRDQRSNVLAAMHAAANAVFLARGAQPPFPAAQGVEQPVVPLAPFDEELETARSEVAKLAQISLMGSAAASAQALAAVADVLEAADGQRRVTAKVAQVRFEAERLRRG